MDPICGQVFGLGRTAVLPVRLVRARVGCALQAALLMTLCPLASAAQSDGTTLRELISRSVKAIDSIEQIELVLGERFGEEVTEVLRTKRSRTAVSTGELFSEATYRYSVDGSWVMLTLFVAPGTCDHLQDVADFGSESAEVSVSDHTSEFGLKYLHEGIEFQVWYDGASDLPCAREVRISRDRVRR